ALVNELFERHADLSADSLAAICDNRQVTYRVLNRRANQLANYLISLGVGAESCVAICFERDIDLVIAILGILKSGAAYIPLDPTYPTQRLAYMIEDSGASVLLGHAHLSESMPDCKRLIKLDSNWETFEAYSDADPIGRAWPQSIAYSIYTSGSTG